MLTGMTKLMNDFLGFFDEHQSDGLTSGQIFSLFCDNKGLSIYRQDRFMAYLRSQGVL